MQATLDELLHKKRPAPNPRLMQVFDHDRPMHAPHTQDALSRRRIA